MKTVTVRFVVPDDEANALDRELRHSHILEEWPLFEWYEEAATKAEIEWYKREYEDAAF